MGYLHDTDIGIHDSYIHIGQDFIKGKKVRCLNEPEISVCRQFSVQKSKSKLYNCFS